jgi:hypothetical protein
MSRIYFRVDSSSFPVGSGSRANVDFYDDRVSAEKAAKHNSLCGLFSVLYRCGQVIDGKLMPDMYLCQVEAAPQDMGGVAI